MAPGHPREGGEEEGVRRQVPKVGVFPPMLCYMANTPAVRRNPVRLFSRGPKWKRTAVTVPPLNSDEEKRRWKGKKIHRNYKLLRRWIFLETFIVFPVSSRRAPLRPRINMYTTRHFSLNTPLKTYTFKNIHENIGRSPTP